MAAVSMTVNGKAVTGDIEPRTLLVQFLRENLRLTGTHVGCDTSQCGACVVHMDGRAIKACTILAVQCDGAHLTTIEGLANGAELHPMQAAFREHHGLQCGFCTPGFLMSIDAYLREHPGAGREELREALAGNLCRCTGYLGIIEAVEHAASEMRGASDDRD
jgi:aerobic carbon-monoxide dehydrogenase small subunit